MARLHALAASLSGFAGLIRAAEQNRSSHWAMNHDDMEKYL